MVASSIAVKYATDANPASAEEMLRPTPAAAAPPPAPTIDVSDPADKPSGGAKRPTRAPERKDEVDWGDIAKEGSRVARSGAFNTILKSILRGFGKR